MNYLSRNNIVTLTEEGYVRKQFADKKECQRERKLYAQLSMLDFLPKVMGKGDNYIDLAYLGEHTVQKILDEKEAAGEIQGFLEVMYKLAELFKRLHAYRDYEFVYRDVNFRNFIEKDGKLYCVDLADIATGDLCQPLGETIAFLLTYDEAFTPFKFDCTNQLLDYYVKNFGYEKWQYIDYAKRMLHRLAAQREKYWNIESIIACII
jgi:hypothetical protein